MYILLGILLLGFKIIHGEIIQCPIGGLTNEIECNKLIQGSVMQKFYITSCEKPISVNTSTENKYETFDYPYIGFDYHQTHSDVNTSKFKQNYLSEDELYHYEIFRKSLILNDTIPIEKRWNDALDIETDTYIIKFHNKLVNQYNDIKKLSSNEEYMVFLQSYYKASSTYYFYKNYDFAYNVISDGLEFFELVKEQLYTPTNDELQKKHARVWYILLLTLKIDIMNCMNTPDEKIKKEAITKLLTEEKQFNSLDYGSFPSSAVLLFRRYFLDNSIDDKTDNKLQTWLTNNKLWESLDDDILYRKHISMYKFLVFFTNSHEYNDKLSNIYKAIERPVLSTEDRLLNYQATKLALETIGSCIDPDDFSSCLNICSKFKKYKNSNTGLESIIIPKLLILYKLRNIQNEKLIEDLFDELMMDNYIIEQDILHLIVTATLDIDISSEKYQTKIKNVKLAIRLLNAYVNSHDKNEDNQDKFKTKGTIKIIKENDEAEIEENESIEINLDELSKTIYTEEERINNLFIAYKWLMELNDALNNYSPHKKYKTEILYALNNANKLLKDEKRLLGTEYFVKDEHFSYLQAKRKNKIHLPLDKWVATARPGVWVRSMSDTNKSKINYLTEDMEQKMLNQLINLNNNSKCPYINRIEILTIIFRYAQKLKLDSVEMYIKSAIAEIVVTPEDRLRNFEAHELFTMYLMERNEIGIKMNKIGSQDFNEDGDGLI